MNIQSRVFPHVIDKQPFQEHLSCKNIVLPQQALSPRRPEQWTCRGFPSVTDKWPFQDISQVKPSHQFNVLRHPGKWPYQNHPLRNTMELTQ